MDVFSFWMAFFLELGSIPETEGDTDDPDRSTKPVGG